MKEFVIIQDYLVEPHHFSDWHENAELAADNLNTVLHTIYANADEDVDPEKLIELLNSAVALLASDEYLTEFEDEDEISNWVDLFLADQL